MTRILVIRYLALAAPIAVVVAAAWLAGARTATEQGRREAGAALLAFVTAAVGISVLDAVGQHLGWYAWAAVDGAFRGMPVDLWLGWAILWGPVPVLLRRWLPVPVALLALLWLDTVALPALTPVLRLGPYWLTGEGVGLLAVALPAILLGRWTAEQRQLVARATLQLVTFAAVAVWLVPATAVAAGGGSWDHLVRAPMWQLSLLVQIAALASVPGVLAVREFTERGGGTPYPWDPPRRLVTTGPYAYVANPMQLSGVALLLVVAAAVHSWTLVVAAGCAAAFSGFLAGPHERHDLLARYGDDWRAYRRQVRDWWPRWRPYRCDEAANLYLAGGCELCRTTREALARRAPTGLTLVPAEAHPASLRRARYEHRNYAVDGVPAVARGLEHVNLYWAYAGWLLRVPVLDRLVQVTADGLGAGPRDLHPDTTGARQ